MALASPSQAPDRLEVCRILCATSKESAFLTWKPAKFQSCQDYSTLWQHFPFSCLQLQIGGRFFSQARGASGKRRPSPYLYDKGGVPLLVPAACLRRGLLRPGQPEPGVVRSEVRSAIAPGNLGQFGMVTSS